MRKYALIIIILLAAGAGIYLGYIKSHQDYPRPTGPTVSLSFLDAERGGGVVIRTPEGAWLIVDPGPASRANALIEHLRWLGISKLAVVITNPTRSHIGALANILDAFEVNQVIHCATLPRAGLWLDAARDMESRGIKDRTVAAGDTISLSNSIKIAVLSPPTDRHSRVKRDSDDNSLVLQLRYGDKRFLLTSDIRATSESNLIKLDTAIESDVLMLARSGRYGSNSLELISCVRPAYCILSCGGFLGTPSPSVLRRVDRKNSGADLYRTDKDGTIEVVSDGCRISVDTHVGGG